MSSSYLATKIQPVFFRKPTLSQFSDEELIRRYRQREDPALVGELFSRYTDLAFLVSVKYVRNEDEAKDVVMQVFEKLLHDLPRYQVRNFRSWLHTVVRNHSLAAIDRRDRQRRRNDKLATEAQRLETAYEPAPTLPAENETEAFRLRQLHEALAELKTEQRRCVELFYLQEKSYKEIADQTGYTLKQVKSYIQNGKRNLRIRLERAGVQDWLPALLVLVACMH